MCTGGMEHTALRRSLGRAGLTALAALLALPAAGLADPIPQDPLNDPPPAFEGAPAKPRRLISPEPPRHPFMAPNGRSNLHSDAFQTDANRWAGPLGRDMTVTSTFEAADCASVTFDSKGRIVTICVGVDAPSLDVFDPTTLDKLASMQLPPRSPGGGSPFNDFAGGGYFYLDDRDRAVIPTTSRHLLVVAVRDAAGGRVRLETERDYDLTAAVAQGDKIFSALPDFSGRIWFVTSNGVVGTVDPATGTVRRREMGEPIANSFAVADDGAVYIVTQAALYRFDAAPDGAPAVTWREVYRNSAISKPGQVHAGSGTTPTVMSGDRIAITDNADPMNVVVYRGARDVGGSRLICEEPVFRKGASATDNSLIAARNSLVVENNYGYTGPASTTEGATTAPGLARVDVRKDGRGCRTVWRSDEVAPTVVPKLSLETGLVYTYTKPPRDDRLDAWYFTALDFCTGRRRYRRLTGTGLGFNNNYAPVTLGPNGVAYVGVLGGLVRIADAVRPTGPAPGAPRGCAPRPRLKLRPIARRGRDARGRGCLRAPIRVALAGKDRTLARRARFRLGNRVRTDSRAPFARTVLRRARRSTVRVVRARVTLGDGRTARVRKRIRICS